MVTAVYSDILSRTKLVLQHILLTFKPEGKLADGRFIIRIVIVCCTVDIPSSPIKFCPTLMAATDHQGTIAVVFKLWFVPSHFCPHLCNSNVLVGRTVYHNGA